MTQLLYKEESYQIIGAAFNVYKDKGCGFLEPVYQECFEIELEYQQIPFKSQVELQVGIRKNYKYKRPHELAVVLFATFTNSGCSTA